MIASDLTRQDVVEDLLKLDLDWGDEEDAVRLVDVLLEVLTPAGAYIWLAFWDRELDGIPLAKIAEGRSRDVFRAARVLVARRSS